MGGLKGIIPLISTLMFSAFGPQIAGFIDNTILRVKALGANLFGL
jgi:hypothetical protein